MLRSRWAASMKQRALPPPNQMLFRIPWVWLLLKATLYPISSLKPVTSTYLRYGGPYTLTMNSPSTVADSAQEKPFSVSAPFNSDTGADAILRTCDGYRKSIITLVSSIFDDMFSLPQPKAAENQQQLEDGLPVVDLSEAGPIIDTLLRF